MKTYTTVRLAKKLRVSRNTIYRWMRAGKIKGARVIRVAEGVAIRAAQWTDKDVALIKTYMKGRYWKGGGRKPKPKP